MIALMAPEAPTMGSGDAGADATWAPAATSPARR